MPKQSAALLVFHWTGATLEVFLVHPGGPFWRGKDAGSWSLPKGEPDDNEELLAAARREFAEEVGRAAPAGEQMALGAIRQASGKVITTWAVESVERFSFEISNEFEIEWPRKSGNIQRFPEVDAGEWFELAAAREKLSEGQRGFLDELLSVLDVPT